LAQQIPDKQFNMGNVSRENAIRQFKFPGRERGKRKGGENFKRHKSIRYNSCDEIIERMEL
jgi:hypothetical protein